MVSEADSVPWISINFKDTEIKLESTFHIFGKLSSSIWRQKGSGTLIKLAEGTYPRLKFSKFFRICLLTFEIILICISLSSAILDAAMLLVEFNPESPLTGVILLIGTVTSATCNGSLTVCLAILACERVIATINYKQYETQKYRTIMAFCIFGIIIAGIFDCYMWVFRGMRNFKLKSETSAKFQELITFLHPLLFMVCNFVHLW